MRKHKYLWKLKKSSLYRLSKLEARAQNLFLNKNTISSDFMETEASFIVINLLTYWSNFCKYYYISCALGAKSGKNGYFHSAFAIQDENTAIGLSIVASHTPSRLRNLNPNTQGVWPKKDEPKWYVSSDYMKLFQNSDITNYNIVDSAFSFGFKVFNDLPTFRNYYAHRNRQTSRSASMIASKYQISTTRKPTDILLTPISNNQCLLSTWIREIVFVIKFLCR